MDSARPIERDDATSLFFISALAFLVAAATVAACAPIGLAMAIVFLFAGPHNWIEFRYFLSRLPARFGRLKRFFAWGIIGVAVLSLFYVALYAGLNFKFIPHAAAGVLYSIWNSAVILWVLRLVFLTAAQRPERDWGWAVPVAALLLVANWLNPALFGVALVYAHPIIAMCILDREIVRNKPAWRKPYHLCLGVIALLVVMIWWQYRDVPVVLDTDYAMRVITRAGGGVLPFAGKALVATHAFLETVHYAIWLMIIPIASAGWKSFCPRSIPIASRSLNWKKAVGGAFVFSTFAAVALWVAFGLSFAAATDVYFTLAIAHVLAEIPFLLKGVM